LLVNTGGPDGLLTGSSFLVSSFGSLGLLRKPNPSPSLPSSFLGGRLSLSSTTTGFSYPKPDLDSTNPSSYLGSLAGLCFCVYSKSFLAYFASCMPVPLPHPTSGSLPPVGAT